jgi:hypothetical protein
MLLPLNSIGTPYYGSSSHNPMLLGRKKDGLRPCTLNIYGVRVLQSAQQ